MWGMFIIYFLLQKFVRASLTANVKLAGFALALWLCMPYNIFYKNSNWFAGMQQLNKQLTGTHYYFADHDNMAHWNLLHGFNDSIHVYNLDTTPFKIFKLYYEKQDSTAFYPGWFVVNTQYSEHSDGFMQRMDSLSRSTYFARTMIKGDMRAMYVEQPAQLATLKKMVDGDTKVLR